MGWHNQIPFLAEQGYRVIVPDQRGYNLSDKPTSVQDYHLDTLAADIRNLTTALGYSQIYLVGHDWGAAVAWWVATLYPEILKKLVILNVPYPTIMMKELRGGNIGQILKSWYIGFFQLPAAPEWLLSRNNYRGLERMLQNSSLPDTFSDEDITQYKAAWSQPNAVTSMLNWYRSLGRSGTSGSQRSTRITTPTLMLWGEKDIALSKDLAQPSIELCDDGELIFFPNATHWVQHDEADAVNQYIHEFLSSVPEEV